ncbi:hypothetical protein [Polymorphobacter megasporae]|uniref:hypothetical protein n=1 Tax=Glacieibacterium megasporae TaxID=2835787 RepID=UPI001C1E22EF|nr:hypothetical protein [Polymorphobacter megasporae]UAJ12427.1 hypothetical protein KTC28_21715 [Polymorphobacter megasporae]
MAAPTGDVVARAFELAADTHYTTVREIARQLDKEGYANVAAHLQSLALSRQLRQVIAAR